MTVKECYDAMGADYEDVAGRLRTDERIRKFVLKVLNDSSYALLCSSLEERNIPGCPYVKRNQPEPVPDEAL